MTAVRRLFDETMLSWFRAGGMRPAVQTRSRELVVRFFNEALLLLDSNDFDSLSVEALCERSDATVGAFYSRFENKGSFVEALQRLVVAVTSQRVMHDYGVGVAPRDDLAHLLTWIVRGSVAWFRDYEGLVRASLRRANGERNMWTPMRELGELQISLALPMILQALPRDASGATEERCRFAFQMLYGTLNNMVLINPGPFSIRNRQTAVMLSTSFVRLLEPPCRVADVSQSFRAKTSRRTSARTRK